MERFCFCGVGKPCALCTEANLKRAHRSLALAQRAGTIAFLIVLGLGVWAGVSFVNRFNRERGLYSRAEAK